jgi:Raf kinase inhibitor-like YbhB/YbcL family protein
VAMTLTSPAFAHGEEIPKRYTSDGENIPPPLDVGGIPEGAQSLVLIVEDPDAPDPANPRRTWCHWILCDLPPSTTSLPEGVRDRDLPEGTRVGSNDWGRQRWGGPEPPIGRHRYFFRLYALDTRLSPGAVTKEQAATRLEVLRAMEGHVLAEAELMGTYQKRRGRSAA